MTDNDSDVDHLRLELNEADRAETLEFDPEFEVSIGRSEECEIRLETRKASRHHARIACQDRRYIVIDLDSANGTFLNGTRVTRQAVLFLGDVLSVGVATIRVDAGPAEERPAAETLQASEGESSGSLAPARPAQSPVPSSRPLTAPRSSLAGSVGVIAVGVFVVFLAWWTVRGFRTLLSPLENAGEVALDDAEATNRARGDGGTSNDTPNATVPSPQPPRPDADERESDSSVDAVPSEPPSVDHAAASKELENSEVGEEPGTLADLLQQLTFGSDGQTDIRQLRETVDRKPSDPDAPFVKRLLPVLEGVEYGAQRARRASADAHVDALLKEKAFGEALAAVSVLGTIDTDDHWKHRVAEIDLLALEDFKAVERRLSELTAAGRPGEALGVLAEMKSRYSGMPSYDETLSKHVQEALSVRGVTAGEDRSTEQLSSPEALALKDRLAVAFEACRFVDAPALYYALLAMEPGPSERIELLNGLVEATLMERMFSEFLARCAEETSAISPYSGEIGRITAADETTIQFELDMEGVVAAYQGKVAWRGLTFLKKFELFSEVKLTPYGLLGVVAYAFRSGHEEGAHATLIRLKKRDGFQSLADVVFAAHVGEPVPDGGFVEYRKRLVTPAYRDAEIARRKKLKEEELAARAEIRRLKKDSKLDAYLEIAKRYRARGLFQLAHSILKALARRFPSSPAGSAAKEMVGDSLLTVRDLKVTGSPENRLDIYLLGEGYPLDDEYQEAFFLRANAALGRLLKDEPYREYAPYFNYYAVALASKDRGLDRHPGGIQRDTALNGKIEWDRFTVERSKVRDVLSRVGEGGKDRQAIVIGNDYAGVATGGGGVACMSKGSLNALPHEIGHSLANLHDEYDFEPGTNPGRNVDNSRDPNVPTSPYPPNLMRGSDRDDVLANAHWRYWIEAGVERWWNGAGVSVFQGGNRRRFNYWRPQASCKMRTGSTKFCVVCMETMMMAIYRHVRPIDRADPEDRKVVLAPDETKQVRLWPLKPQTHFLVTRWRLFTAPSKDIARRTGVAVTPRPVKFAGFGRRIDADGQPVEFAVIRGRDLEPGRYRLEATVSDPTPWVLRDEKGLLTEKREWIVVVEEKKEEK